VCVWFCGVVLLFQTVCGGVGGGGCFWVGGGGGGGGGGGSAYKSAVVLVSGPLHARYGTAVAQSSLVTSTLWVA